ncbi:hypothetical protein, partial [Streptomyces capuensis]|uniref:hypothetical protein n=1 Tax=Streptomyces capuensis TaxID=1464056 RepID=UPI0005187D71
PGRTRDDAHPGYHQTLAAIDHTPPAGQKPRLQRDWGTGEYSWLREPEEKFIDGQAALEAAEASRGNDPEAVRKAARRMARAQKAGHASARWEGLFLEPIYGNGLPEVNEVAGQLEDEDDHKAA